MSTIAAPISAFCYFQQLQQVLFVFFVDAQQFVPKLTTLKAKPSIKMPDLVAIRISSFVSVHVLLHFSWYYFTSTTA